LFLQMKKTLLLVLFVEVLLGFLNVDPVSAGLTGKISGQVISSEKSALPGANVIIEGTTLGAATDVSGNYFIINVPPGQYQLLCKMTGFATIRKTNVYVSANLTTEINFELQPVVIEGETVTIIAERPVIQKDVAGSESVMREEDIQVFSQDAFGDFLSTRIGISLSADEDGSGISIRGGDISEINVVMNGMSLRNALTQQANL